MIGRMICVKATPLSRGFDVDDGIYDLKDSKLHCRLCLISMPCERWSVARHEISKRHQRLLRASLCLVTEYNNPLEVKSVEATPKKTTIIPDRHVPISAQEVFLNRFIQGFENEILEDLKDFVD